MLSRSPTLSPISHEAISRRYAPHGYVCHAFGEIDGEWYTNAREAFVRSYQRGFRIFEADMVLLADGKAIVAHDQHEQFYGLDKRFQDATWDEVKDLRYLGRKKRNSLSLPSSVMDMPAFVELLAAHPDAYVISDTKTQFGPQDHIRVNEQIAEAAPKEVRDRIIPHLRDQEELDAFRQVYDWKDYMLALYRTQWRARYENDEVISFVKENGIRGVMMWFNQWDHDKTMQENHRAHQRFDLPFVHDLQSAGVGAYVHDMIEEAAVRRFRQHRVGVYSKQWFELPRTERVKRWLRGQFSS